MLAWVLGVVLASTAPQAASVEHRTSQGDACRLIGAEDIRLVQDAAVATVRASEVKSRGLRFAHCLFATADVARSVSLTLIMPEGGVASDGVRRYWAETLRPRARETNPPRPAPAVPGEDAFWTGDARTGALYVLSGAVALRISAGGVTDEAERLRRSTALAQAALQRLRHTPE